MKASKAPRVPFEKFAAGKLHNETYKKELLGHVGLLVALLGCSAQLKHGCGSKFLTPQTDTR